MAKAWPLVEELIEAACLRDGLYTPISVFRWLRDDRMQLWIAGSRSPEGRVVVEACALTEMLQHEKEKTGGVFMVTGRGIDRWFDHIGTIEAWLWGQGCDRIVHTIRPGYGRRLKKRGYARTHELWEKHHE